MKKWLADLMLRLFRDTIEQASAALAIWLLDRLRARLKELWRQQYEKKRSEQKKASEEKQQAETTGYTEAARAAAAREAAAAQDAELIRKMGEAAAEAVESVAAEVPQAVKKHGGCSSTHEQAGNFPIECFS